MFVRAVNMGNVDRDLEFGKKFYNLNQNPMLYLQPLDKRFYQHAVHRRLETLLYWLFSNLNYRYVKYLPSDMIFKVNEFLSGCRCAGALCIE
jgi:hypothetical protein